MTTNNFFRSEELSSKFTLHILSMPHEFFNISEIRQLPHKSLNDQTIPSKPHK
jgi:hypothetical protein